jgi:hypothetical protein
MCNKSQGFYGLNSTLSPEAQAVLDAFNNRGLSSREWHDGKAASLKLAAALYAAADQVAPEDFDYWDGRTDDYAFGCETGQNERNAHVRAKLLDIANELEAL